MKIKSDKEPTYPFKYPVILVDVDGELYIQKGQGHYALRLKDMVGFSVHSGLVPYLGVATLENDYEEPRNR